MISNRAYCKIQVIYILHDYKSSCQSDNTATRTLSQMYSWCCVFCLGGYFLGISCSAGSGCYQIRGLSFIRAWGGGGLAKFNVKDLEFYQAPPYHLSKISATPPIFHLHFRQPPPPHTHTHPLPSRPIGIKMCTCTFSI